MTRDVDPAGIMSLTEHELAVNRQLTRFAALENIVALTREFIAKAGWAPVELADAIDALDRADKRKDPGVTP
jgi:hypothetical protein